MQQTVATPLAKISVKDSGSRTETNLKEASLSVSGTQQQLSSKSSNSNSSRSKAQHARSREDATVSYVSADSQRLYTQVAP